MLDLSAVLKNDSCPQETADALKEFWDKALFHPWQEVNSRPRKSIRSQFVELGWLLAGAPGELEKQTLHQMGEIIETLHLGSLIIDDIQDNSDERRGLPSLHQMYGVPLALNLGNFLYFQALHLISQLPVSDHYKNKALLQITQTLRDAHLGQALDVSVAIDQIERSKIPKLVETSMRLKSGALVKLAIHLGALLNPDFENHEALHCFGESYGSCLQKLDDVGNFTVGSSCKKHLEDLRLRRPSWIWSVFSQKATEPEWKFFNDAVQALPCCVKLQDFVNKTDLKQKAFEIAQTDLAETLALLKFNLDLDEKTPAYQLAHQLTVKLTHAY